MSWVGRIAGAGFASPTVVAAACGGAFACAVAGGAADLVADGWGAGSGDAAATAGFGAGSGTARVATCGIGAGGRGVPRITIGGGSAVSGP